MNTKWSSSHFEYVEEPVKIQNKYAPIEYSKSPWPKNEPKVHLLHANMWKALKKEAHPFCCRRSVWHKWNAAAVVTDHWVFRRAPVPQSGQVLAVNHPPN
ncbi:hypothetical protein CEXT_719421 [Caerostris extrusa]|uniref:Uncharacterized protein n=1 Tax=Caerostris extrusa TaxID=172846 RepID=A0AAV4U1G9_CAEEX|nr:hypothetical protein CEXT_719421 [Caerostris extrusa]